MNYVDRDLTNWVELDETAARSVRMSTHKQSKRRKFVRAAFRRWGRRHKKPGDQPSRELRRSW